MQFLSIFTYKPAKRDEVLNKRMEGLFIPEGAKCLGQWSDVSGGRVVTLGEVDDLMVLYSWAHAWTDLGKFELFPVVETDELIKAMGPKE